MFEIEIGFVCLISDDLSRPTLIQLLQAFRVPKKFKNVFYGKIASKIASKFK